MKTQNEQQDYSEYTVQLNTEPSYYGSDCTQERANEIVSTLTGMIEGEFPGISVETWRDGERSSSTTGPSDDAISEINRWIEENWTAAL